MSVELRELHRLAETHLFADGRPLAKKRAQAVRSLLDQNCSESNATHLRATVNTLDQLRSMLKALAENEAKQEELARSEDVKRENRERFESQGLRPA